MRRSVRIRSSVVAALLALVACGGSTGSGPGGGAGASGAGGGGGGSAGGTGGFGLGGGTGGGGDIDAGPMPAGDACATAILLADAGVFAGQSTAGHHNDYAPSANAPGCTGFGNAGLDRVFAVDVGPGEQLSATVVPDGGEDPSLYLLADLASCAPVPGSCLAGADQRGRGGVEVVAWANRTSSAVRVFIVVDSFFVDSMTFSLIASYSAFDAGAVSTDGGAPDSGSTDGGSTDGGVPDGGTDAGGAGSGFYDGGALVDAGVWVWTSNVTVHRGNNGRRVYGICPPMGTQQAVWGTGTYTDHSSVCTAGVHSGLVSFADGGALTVEIRPGQSAYTGSAANGFSTGSYVTWAGSFVFVP